MTPYLSPMHPPPHVPSVYSTVIPCPWRGADLYLPLPLPPTGAPFQKGARLCPAFQSATSDHSVVLYTDCYFVKQLFSNSDYTCTWRGGKCDICCQCTLLYRTTWDLHSSTLFMVRALLHNIFSLQNITK